jgi:hypothetical protein
MDIDISPAEIACILWQTPPVAACVRRVLKAASTLVLFHPIREVRELPHVDIYRHVNELTPHK